MPVKNLAALSALLGACQQHIKKKKKQPNKNGTRELTAAGVYAPAAGAAVLLPLVWLPVRTPTYAALPAQDSLRRTGFRVQPATNGYRLLRQRISLPILFFRCRFAFELHLYSSVEIRREVTSLCAVHCPRKYAALRYRGFHYLRRQPELRRRLHRDAICCLICAFVTPCAPWRLCRYEQ